MSEDMINLESKLAFQEHSLHELNEIVTDQQAQLDRLREEIRILNLRIQAMAETTVNSSDKEPPPPHY